MVADPNWFVRCKGCKHAEQVHNAHGCTAGPLGRQCICDRFSPGRREWVGKGPRPEAA